MDTQGSNSFPSTVGQGGETVAAAVRARVRGFPGIFFDFEKFKNTNISIHLLEQNVCIFLKGVFTRPKLPLSPWSNE